MIRRTFRPYGGDGGLLPPRLSIMAWFDRLTFHEPDPPVGAGRRGPVWEGHNGKREQ